jgi:hypothetical protein
LVDGGSKFGRQSEKKRARRARWRSHFARQKEGWRAAKADFALDGSP